MSRLSFSERQINSVTQTVVGDGVNWDIACWMQTRLYWLYIWHKLAKVNWLDDDDIPALVPTLSSSLLKQDFACLLSIALRLGRELAYDGTALIIKVWGKGAAIKATCGASCVAL